MGWLWLYKSLFVVELLQSNKECGCESGGGCFYLDTTKRRDMGSVSGSTSGFGSVSKLKIQVRDCDGI